MSLTKAEVLRAAEVAETYPKGHATYWGRMASGRYTTKPAEVAPGQG